jgi:hypothetical protein
MFVCKMHVAVMVWTVITLAVVIDMVLSRTLTESEKQSSKRHNASTRKFPIDELTLEQEQNRSQNQERNDSDETATTTIQPDPAACPTCNGHLQKKKQFEILQTERVKSQILSKLRMEAPPNLTHGAPPTIPIDVLSHELYMQDDMFGPGWSGYRPVQEPDPYYAQTQQVVLMSKDGK